MLKSIAIIDSSASASINFRGDLIKDLVERGVKVWAISPDLTRDKAEKIRALGALPIASTLRRAGTNPFSDIKAGAQMWYLLRRLRPRATFCCTIKPATYGTIAAFFAGVKNRFALIEGLGFAFMDDKTSKTIRRRALRFVAKLLYRLALPLASRVFVINKDDMADLAAIRAISKEKTSLINGIGVDLQHFLQAPSVTEPVTFVLVARMLREKGVFDFINAAKILQSTGAKFVLLGGVDANPSSIKESDLKAWSDSGAVDWAGSVLDVRPYLARTSVFVLPSYREGLPRSTMEAMALGRPIITTNVAGCKETVEEGKNGFFVPVRDPKGLCHAMKRFIDDPSIISKMGECSRKMAEEKFDVIKINKQIIGLIETSMR